VSTTIPDNYGLYYTVLVCGHQLDVRQSQCATVGDRAFATAGARLWNSLPADIVACDTLPQFRRELKAFLFRLTYPSVLLKFFLCGP